jgi:hypothetical protein
VTGVYHCSVAWGDADNDGDLDLAVAGWSMPGRITTVYENDGAGGFTEFPGLDLKGVDFCSLSWATATTMATWTSPWRETRAADTPRPSTETMAQGASRRSWDLA